MSAHSQPAQPPFLMMEGQQLQVTFKVPMALKKVGKTLLAVFKKADASIADSEKFTAVHGSFSRQLGKQPMIEIEFTDSDKKKYGVNFARFIFAEAELKSVQKIEMVTSVMA